MTSQHLIDASASTRTESEVRAQRERTKRAILSLNEVPKHQRWRNWSYVDPSDIDPDTNEPYDNYESLCIEPHPFGGGISAGDY